MKVKLNWNWCATTLNPYYEGNSLNCTVLDDRLIMHTLDRWEFGTDFVGDITMDSTHRALEQRAHTMGQVRFCRSFSIKHIFDIKLEIRKKKTD